MPTTRPIRASLRTAIRSTLLSLFGLASLLTLSPTASATINKVEGFPHRTNATSGFALSNSADLVFSASDGSVQALYSVPTASSGIHLTINGNNFGETYRSAGVTRSNTVSALSGNDALLVSGAGGPGVTVITIRGNLFAAPDGFSDAQPEDSGSLLAITRTTQNTSFGGMVRRFSTDATGSLSSTPVFSAADLGDRPYTQLSTDGRGNVAVRAASTLPNGTPRDITTDPILVARSSGGVRLTVRGESFGLHSLSQPDIDGDGIAFFGTGASGQKKIIHRDLATFSVLLDTTAPSDIQRVALSTGHGVCFSTLTGIYLAKPNGAHEPIISIGDALDGSTVTGFTFDPRGLNDNGILAFHATLANGTDAFFLTPIPTPAAATLAALTLLTNTRRRRNP